MDKNKDKQEQDNESDFYDGVAKAANFVNKRLDDTIAPGGLNNTIDEYVEDEKEDQ